MSFGMPRYNRQADRRTEKHTPGGQIKASQVIGTTGRYNKRTDRAAGRQAGRQIYMQETDRKTSMKADMYNRPVESRTDRAVGMQAGRQIDMQGDR